MSAVAPESDPIAVEPWGRDVLVGRITGREHGLFERDGADSLSALVERAESDAAIRTVVLTGTHPERFISHADIGWLQRGGAGSPSVESRAASAVIRAASATARSTTLSAVADRTPLSGALELDRLHATLMRMNRSGVIYVAALNGSALGFGAELSWACDVRLMARGDHFIGQPEVLLGFPPGGGGTQRLTRLVGTHRGMLAMIEGRPLGAEEALEIGALDELVEPAFLLERAVERGRELGSRPRRAIAAIKRAAYLGGSMPLPDGLALERAEFLATLSTEQAQDRMLEYMRATDAAGELPLYEPERYGEALRHGGFIDSGSGA